MKQDQDESASLPAEANSAEELPLIELESLLIRPPSRRKRLIQLGLVGVVLTALVVTFWEILVPTHAPPARHSPPPTVLIISSNISMGTISVNRLKQQGVFPMRVSLPSLATQVTLEAPPFRPVSCLLSAVQSTTPTESFHRCSLRQGTLTPPTGGPDWPALYVTILLTSADLPLAQQQQISTLIPQVATFQQGSTVPTGAYVATGIAPNGVITSQLTTTPLQAGASLTPSTSVAAQASWNCDTSLCYITTSLTPPQTHPSQSWVIAVPLTLRWHFASTQGLVISDVSYAPQGHLLVSLSYSETIGWQKTQSEPGGEFANQISAQSCGIGALLLQSELRGTGWTLTTIQEQGMDGCTLEAQQNGVDQGHFLWRFGVILAIDAKAQATLPDLPIAPPEEVAESGV